MKPGIPWSVKGIESEAREAAKYAARRSGMTLGEWLNSIILEQADNKDETDRRHDRRLPPGARPSHDETSDLRQRLDHLSEQLSALNLRDQDSATGRYLARSIQDPEADPALKSVMRRLENNEIQFTAAIDKVAERIDELAGRVDQPPAPAVDERVDELMARMQANEQHASGAIDRLGEEVSGLARQMSHLPAPKSFERPEDVPGFSSLEAALRNVVDHIEVSDKRTRDTLKTLQDRLSTTHRLAETAKAGPDHDAALERLEKQLSQLAERMQSQERQGLGAVRQMVDEKFSRLSEQMSTVSHSADTLVEKAETAAGRQVQAAEQRLQSMIAEATAKAAREDDGVELARLRNDIDALGRRLEALKSDTASEHEVRSLKTALEEVSNSVAGGPDTGPLAMLEERISALSSEIDARAGSSAVDDNLTALARRLDDLDAAVRGMSAPDAGGSGELDSLKQHIAAVDERLSATEQQLSHLETIEKSIGQLFEAVESNKASSEEIAEATARRVADEMASRSAPDAGGDPKTATAIQALEEGLSAVKASAETADQRNNETLEAVHETLEHIISKLGELESWHSTAAAKMAREHADAEPGPGPEDAGTSDEPSDALDEIAEPAAGEHDDTPWQSLMPDLGGSDSLGDGEASTGEAETLAEDAGDASFMPSLPSSIDAGDDTDSAPELPAEPALMPGEDDTPAKPAHEDYIAAARRAAQTAQPRSPLAPGGAFSLFARKKSTQAEPAEPKPDKGDKSAKAKAPLLSMPFLKLKAKPEDKVADKAPASAEEAAARRKRLILVGAVLLAAAAAYSLNARRSAQPPAQPPAKVGEVTPGESPVKPDALVKRALASKADASIEAARTKPVANTLTSRSGLASLDAIEQQSASDPITTASLPRKANEPLVSRNEDVASRLSALVKGTAKTEARPQPSAPLAALPAAIGAAALRQAALNGNPSAQFVIASRYLEGKGVAADAAAAAHWYERAAAQNLASAQYRLATLFERGIGVPKDLAAARLWYQRAAEAGNVRAMHNLAVLLADNANGKADYPAAARWFAAAAQYGLKDSEFNLAVLRERGLGVTTDRKEAYRLYSLAARQGDNGAAARAKILRNYLSSSEAASVDGEVAAWTPKAIEKTANYVTIADKNWGVDMAGPQKALPPSPQLTGAKLIAQAQKLLAKLGFDVGTPDGVMGTRTANAVRLYQMKNHLPVNGMVSNQLLRHLMAQTG